MNPNRYQRQLQLPGFGKEGQDKLLHSKVLVIGAGGLGVPVLQYLTAMGVGTIGVIDGDVVSRSNLHRQVIYSENDVGELKVDRCVARLREQNPDILLHSIPFYLSSDNALSIVKDYDLVIDATDNFKARYLINDTCVILGIPFVYGALQQYEGHVSVFNLKDGPTYRCLYPSPPGSGQIPDCNTAGVLGIVPGLIGSYQALEAVKILAGIGKPLSGTLLVFDFLNNSQYPIKLLTKQENKNIRHLPTASLDSTCTEHETLSPEELALWIREGKSFHLVDVREEHEYHRSHLESAFSFPISRLNGDLPDITPEIPWVILCQMGGRSQKAIRYLKEKHPRLSLFNLDGGLTAWIKSQGEQLIITS